MDIEFNLATLADLDKLIEVGDDLFDHPIKPNRAKEFLEDPRHHLFLAYDEGQVVGMVSAFHYVHPDKDPNLFINEAGVVDSYQNKGIGRMLVQKMLEYGKSELGCIEAWVATMESNEQARRSYQAAGGTEEKERVVLIEF